MSDVLRIGIAGLGTVGAGVFRLLQNNREIIAERIERPIEVVAVSSRDRSRNRGIDVSSCRWYEDARLLAEDEELDLVVETIGGEEGIARNVCEAALAHGKHVVTANKALISRHGSTLARQAEAAGCALMFEAAVAGGVPVLKTLREGVAGNRIARIAGILNGTSNFILTKMQQDATAFDVALKEAQALGYAEADPAFDIDGTDAAQKLQILAALAFGCDPCLSGVPVEGITHITPQDIRAAGAAGYVIRLLGIANNTGEALRLCVRPFLLREASPLNVAGVLNAVAIDTDMAGQLVLEGAGAGAEPTASSIVSDIMDLARGNRSRSFSIPADRLKIFPVEQDGSLCWPYFIHGTLADGKDDDGRLAAALDEHGVKVASCTVQPGEIFRFSVMTQKMQLSAVQKACKAAEALECIASMAKPIAIMEQF